MIMATPADLTGISYFLPIFSFLVVWVVVYAVLNKTKIIDDQKVQIFVAFLFATIFVSALGAREYLTNMVVLLVVMLFALFLVTLLIGLAGDKVKDSVGKGIGIAFVIATLIVFIIAAIFVFSSYYAPYLPGGSGAGANPDVLRLVQWIYLPSVAGAIVFIVLAVLVAWLLVRSGKK